MPTTTTPGTGANSALLRVTMPLGFTMLCQLHGACQRLLLARDVLVHVRSPVVRKWGGPVAGDALPRVRPSLQIFVFSGSGSPAQR